MKFANLSVRQKIIFLTLFSLLSSNLILATLLLAKVRIDTSQSFAQEFLTSLTIENLTLITLLFIAICSLLTYFFINKLTKPLQELVFASTQLGYDVSTINFPMDTNDELASLAASLQKMNKTIIKQNESLQNSEQMNRSIMDNMSDGLITMTPDGLIHSYNNAAQKLFGYENSEIQGESFTLLLPEPYQSDFKSFFKKHLTDQQLLSEIQNNVEIIGLRKDGSQFDMELSLTEMTLHQRKIGKKRFFIALCRNIEERKKNEQKLRLAEKIALAAKDEAERANLAKSQFLSRMSHEFRTPLHAIMGFSELALYDEETRKDAGVMQTIHDAGQRLLTMVNDVLDISTVETGEMTINLEIVDVIELMREIYLQALKLANKYEIEVIFALEDSQLPVFAHVDKDRLKQILLILITNAIKFNRKPGAVTLSLRDTSPSQIGIAVKDQGPGIAKENLEKIFKPFERLDAYNKGIDGLGIGLAIAKQLTEAMGGTLGVESEEKVGSVFYVVFPTCKENEHQIIDFDSFLNQLE